MLQANVISIKNEKIKISKFKGNAGCSQYQLDDFEDVVAYDKHQET